MADENDNIRPLRREPGDPQNAAAGGPANADNNPDEAEEELISPENPHALYEDMRFDGQPASKWESFQRWSHRHKRKIYFAFFGAIILSFYILMAQSGPASTAKYLDDYFGRFSKQESDWQYEIGGSYIDRRSLGVMYGLAAKASYGEKGAADLLNDGELFQSFVRDQFETDLLAYAALREGILNDPEGRLLLENSLRHAAADYYVYKKTSAPDQNFRVEVTDAEALAIYNQSPERYKDMDKNAVLAGIKMTISNIRNAQILEARQRLRGQLLDQLRDQIGPRIQGAK